MSQGRRRLGGAGTLSGQSCPPSTPGCTVHEGFLRTLPPLPHRPLQDKREQTLPEASGKSRCLQACEWCHGWAIIMTIFSGDDSKIQKTDLTWKTLKT